MPHLASLSRPGIAHGFAKLGPLQNQLLASLPAASIYRVQPHLESVAINAGSVLCESGSVPECCYFPTTAVISLLQVLASGSMSEVAIAGRDGMIGICVFTGANINTRAVAHCAGFAYRLRSEILQREFDVGGDFRQLMLRYTQVRIAQVAQTLVCYRYHSVDQQVSSRLLMSLDRLISPEIPVTHEVLSSALGVRREAVTLATCRLQAEGIIGHSRGRITVLDRKRLERRACECYAALTAETLRLLPARSARQMLIPLVALSHARV